MKLKKNVWITAAVFLMMVIAACSDQPLTLKDIIASFENQGLQLEKYAKGDLHPNNVFLRELNEVKPQVFELNDKLVSIYIYESEKDRNAGEEDFVRKTAAATVVEHTKYPVKNVILFYVHERNHDASMKAKIQNAINELEQR